MSAEHAKHAEPQGRRAFLRTALCAGAGVLLARGAAAAPGAGPSAWEAACAAYRREALGPPRFIRADCRWRGGRDAPMDRLESVLAAVLAMADTPPRDICVYGAPLRHGRLDSSASGCVTLAFRDEARAEIRVGGADMRALPAVVRGRGGAVWADEELVRIERPGARTRVVGTRFAAMFPANLGGDPAARACATRVLAAWRALG